MSEIVKFENLSRTSRNQNVGRTLVRHVGLKPDLRISSEQMSCNSLWLSDKYTSLLRKCINLTGKRLNNLLVEIRDDERVLLDSDVAQLYGVETKDINKSVANNPDKFPADYILELT